MNRGERHEILNAYLDGSLTSGERLDLERRLGEDAELAAEFEALREIVSDAGRLPREIEPERDLWPGIEAKIRSEKVVPGRFGGFRRTLLAVAALVAIFLAGLLTGVWRSVPGPEDRIAQAPTSEAPPKSGAYDQLEQDYAVASQDLMDVLGQHPDRLDAETVELIRRNLDLIDEAVREIRSALEEEPSNPQLNQLLTGEYRRRSALLRQAADLPGTI